MNWKEVNEFRNQYFKDHPYQEPAYGGTLGRLWRSGYYDGLDGRDAGYSHDLSTFSEEEKAYYADGYIQGSDELWDDID